MVDPIPSEQWEQHKEEILRLYIEEDLPLRHVMKRVWTRDFHPDESQYRSKLKTWRHRKARKSHKVAKGLAAAKSALHSTNVASPPPNINPESRDSRSPTKFDSDQNLNLARLPGTWEERELLRDVRDPIFSSFNFADSTWVPSPGSLHPSSISELIATDPHAEAASDQQHFAMRKSVAEASQCGPGQPRVKRAPRQRPPHRVDKAPPWTRTPHPSLAGSGFSEPLDSVPASPFAHHPPVLQYPPADPNPDFDWWQEHGPFPQTPL